MLRYATLCMQREAGEMGEPPGAQAKQSKAKQSWGMGKLPGDMHVYLSYVSYAKLCYARLGYAKLCYAMLSFVMQSYSKLCRAKLSYAKLCWVMLICAMLSYAKLG